MTTAAHNNVRWDWSGQPLGILEYSVLLETERGRLQVPDALRLTCDIDGLDGLRTVTVDCRFVDGRYLTTRLEATPNDGHPIDFYALQHRMNISTGVRRAAQSKVIYEARDGETYTESKMMADPDPLHQVALVYAIAYAFGEPPTGAVAQTFNLKTNAASQRVKRAREKGYLPPTAPGKAGA
jgi:hypothetical protein